MSQSKRSLEAKRTCKSDGLTTSCAIAGRGSGVAARVEAALRVVSSKPDSMTTQTWERAGGDAVT